MPPVAKTLPCHGITCHVQAVAEESISEHDEPVFPTTYAEPVIVSGAVDSWDSSTAKFLRSNFGKSAERLDGDINDESHPAGLRRKDKRWIRRVLTSGLVIEVEDAGFDGLTQSRPQFASRHQSPATTRTPNCKPELEHDTHSLNNDSTISDHASPKEWESIPPRQNDSGYYFEPMEDLHLEFSSPCQSLTTTRTPSCNHEHDTHLSSDDSAIFDYHYPSEWEINPPRQGGDYHFEQFMDGLSPSRKAFHHDDIWRLQFIPTLLRFLGTQNDPWDWSGDMFVYLLQCVWETVYDEPLWSAEDESFAHTLAAESVDAWFDSFGVSALAAVEIYLKRVTNGVSSFSEWSVLCKQILQDGRLFHGDPNVLTTQGIYQSMFVLAPLSGHLKASFGRKEIQDLSD